MALDGEIAVMNPDHAVRNARRKDEEKFKATSYVSIESNTFVGRRGHMLLACLLMLVTVGVVSYLIMVVGAEPRSARDQQVGVVLSPEENCSDDAA